MNPTLPFTEEHDKAPGLVALGSADAAAAKASGIEVFELACAWSWAAGGEARRSELRSSGGLRPETPMDPSLSSWAGRRVVVVFESPSWSGAERVAMLALARALRVQTRATAVIHTTLGA